MPVSVESAPAEVAAKAGNRPGSAKAILGAVGGPGISKDAGAHRALSQKRIHDFQNYSHHPIEKALRVDMLQTKLA